jgi:GntR family transcriptional regulator
MPLIAIDRKSPETVHRQVAEQIRYLIARGHFTVGSVLPSTRSLGSDLDVSFHTIRKAYSRLEQDGLVEAVPGRGFVVLPLREGTDSDKMEVGAHVIRTAVQKLIGIGLTEADIDYIFDEQFSTLAGERPGPKVIFVGAYVEQAVECVHHIGHLRLGSVIACTAADLDEHEDADYAVCPFPLYRDVRSRLHRAEAIGVDVTLNHEALDLGARLLQHETLALVTLHADAIAPLTREIQLRTGFPGQLLAGSVRQGIQHIRQIATAADVILYSPGARIPISSVTADRRTAPVLSTLADSSLRTLQNAIPSA